jgi:hypothetical protein
MVRDFARAIVGILEGLSVLGILIGLLYAIWAGMVIGFKIVLTSFLMYFIFFALAEQMDYAN